MPNNDKAGSAGGTRAFPELSSTEPPSVLAATHVAFSEVPGTSPCDTSKLEAADGDARGTSIAGLVVAGVPQPITSFLAIMRA